MLRNLSEGYIASVSTAPDLILASLPTPSLAVALAHDFEVHVSHGTY